jgi:hypothetical protein
MWRTSGKVDCREESISCMKLNNHKSRMSPFSGVDNLSFASPHSLDSSILHAYSTPWVECLYPWLVIRSKYNFRFPSNVKVWWFHFQWTILGLNRYSPFHHILQDFCKKMPLQSIFVLLLNLWKIERHQLQSVRKWLAQKLLEVNLSCYEQNADG